MALADQSLYLVKSKSENLEIGVFRGGKKTENYPSNTRIGMEFESDWTRHKKSSAFTTQVISTATSCMHWCHKIRISKGYHEFL